MVAQTPVESGFIPDPAAEQTSNHVEVVGYIGRDPLTRYTADGDMVVSVSLATHHWHDQDGVSVQTTDWHHVVSFGEVASACAELRPGDLVRACGRLHTHSWRDRFGAHHQRTEIIATEVGRVRRRPVQLALKSEPRPFAASAS